MDEMKEESHPSFGLLGFNRVQCGEAMPLFGSDLKHSNVIEMRLFHAARKRGLNRDWNHASERIVSVYMSQNQFAEMITSLNVGDGIPVTINYTERDGRIEEPDFRSVTELHEREFAQKAKELTEKTDVFMQEAEEILSGTGTVKKADRERLLRSLKMMRQDIQSNMPFMETQFHKAMDKVVVDAKGAIEAFYQHRVTEAGLEKLSQEGGFSAPQLIEGKD